MVTDPAKLLEAVVDVAVGRLGLGFLGLSREEYEEMLKPIVEGMLAGSDGGLTLESVAARLEASRQQLYLMASAYLLEKKDELTQEQLEFVVSYGGHVAASYAPRLYKLIEKYGRWDLLPQLRYAWETYGRPTPIPCPRCGFRAVTPELQCMVCGYSLSERELREVTDFREKLREAAYTWQLTELIETIERGVVYLGEEVKPATARPSPLDVEVILTREEKEMLKKILEERRGGKSARGG